MFAISTTANISAKPASFRPRQQRAAKHRQHRVPITNHLTHRPGAGATAPCLRPLLLAGYLSQSHGPMTGLISAQVRPPSTVLTSATPSLELAIAQPRSESTKEN